VASRIGKSEIQIADAAPIGKSGDLPLAFRAASPPDVVARMFIFPVLNVLVS
jgi:hypothetical protein